MASVFDMLARVKKRPDQLGPDDDRAYQLRTLQVVLIGYCSALDLHAIDDPGKRLLRNIEDHLRAERGWSMSCGAIDAILEHSPSPESAWDLFWKEVAIQQRAYDIDRGLS